MPLETMVVVLEGSGAEQGWRLSENEGGLSRPGKLSWVGNARWGIMSVRNTAD